EKGKPLIFRAWKHGDPLEKGVWNIPIPATGAPVLPDIVISPVVGVDTNRYRLGYGGGFYDRTLAAMPRKPLVIGVGYELQRIPTIHAQAHDIPLDVVVTDARRSSRSPGGETRRTPGHCVPNSPSKTNGDTRLGGGSVGGGNGARCTSG